MQKGEKKAKRNPSNSNQSSLESNPSNPNSKPQTGRSKREIKAEEHLKLTEDESDQLGRIVSLDKWIERTKDGKNGGFCVFGYLNVDPMPELKGQGANSQFEVSDMSYRREYTEIGRMQREKESKRKKP